jgi:hypothetical protein
MDEAAILQREGYPLDVIKEFRSMEQYNICKEAGLSQQMGEREHGAHKRY